MDKDRIAALIEGMKRWRVDAPPTPPIMEIRTRRTPWNDMQYYFHDCDGNERIIAWTNPDYDQHFFDSLRGINSNFETSSPVSLLDYIMNEGDE